MGRRCLPALPPGWRGRIAPFVLGWRGATLHLLVLFLGAEMRYWLYDGDIFSQQYSFTEAAINTLLWGALGVTYMVRAGASESLAWLYRLFSRILVALSMLSYLALVTLHNPWWGGGHIGDTPIINMLLPGYGGPILLALAVSRFPLLAPRFWSLCVASCRLSAVYRAGDPATLARGVTWGCRSVCQRVSFTLIRLSAFCTRSALLPYSAKRDNAVLYKAGMALLGLVIAKIFLVDMAGLQGLWRVAAFMGLGLALLGLAWMYRKAQPSAGNHAPSD